jgi:hypothetical protein
VNVVFKYRQLALLVVAQITLLPVDNLPHIR